MSHTPNFAFRTHGGVCAGDQWIYDGDEPIARIDNRAIEQPEQNLRYFDRNLKPVNLYDLKLAPGGRPLIFGVQLFWNMGPVITTELISVEVEGQDSDRLVLTVITQDPGRVATSRRVITIAYDDTLESYVYDFIAHLDLHSPEVFDTPGAFGDGGTIRFECSDPWYYDIPGPTVDFPGMWQKRFTHLLAESSDDTVLQMPLNHMATGTPMPKSFKRDGLFVLGFDPGNNPAFEFVGDTADRTSVSVCNWGYDIHISTRFSREELYQAICPNFRIRLCPDEKVQAMMSTAEPIPPVHYNGFDELPIYERKTSFAKGLRLNEPSPCNTDPWPWLPEGDGCSWCKDEGRSDNFSLKISKETDSPPTEWQMDRESDGAWTQRWTAGIAYRITCYIKTENVQSRGSCLAVRWGVYNYPQRFPYICSQKLVGTHDWTQVEVEIHGPPPPENSSIIIILRQDGPGTTWFDDLEVELLS